MMLLLPMLLLPQFLHSGDHGDEPPPPRRLRRGHRRAGRHDGALRRARLRAAGSPPEDLHALRERGTYAWQDMLDQRVVVCVHFFHRLVCVCVLWNCLRCNLRNSSDYILYPILCMFAE